MILPKSDSSPRLLAKKPSKKSVIAARLNSKAAKNVQNLFGNRRRITIPGIVATL